MEVLKFQRPLQSTSLKMVLVYNKARTFSTLIPFTDELDKDLFGNGKIDITYRECEVSGDKITSIGVVIENINF